MSSKQRVFSHNSDMNYSEYIKNKNGAEILKTLQSNHANNNNNNKNKTLNKFVNYNQFLTLTHAYYKYVNSDTIKLKPTANIYESNISFTCKQDYRDNYNSDSDEDECCNNNCNNNCNKYNKCNKTKNYNICNTVPEVLYPYGAYPTNEDTTVFFPSNLNLNNWCRNKIYDLNDIDYSGLCGKDNSKHKPINCKTKCRTGLCKNAKPLFI